MIRTQIQMKEEQLRKLKQLMAVTHQSMAELIREAVSRFLAAQKIVDREELRKRAIAAAGSCHSKKRDLSKAHDKYLVEAYKR